MSRRQINLVTDDMRSWHVGQEPDGTWIRTRVAEGPAGMADRYVTTRLSDDEVLILLASLAVQPKWAVAFAAITDDPTFLDAVLRNTYHLNSGGRREALIAKMRAALKRREDDDRAE